MTQNKIKILEIIEEYLENRNRNGISVKRIFLALRGKRRVKLTDEERGIVWFLKEKLKSINE